MRTDECSVKPATSRFILCTLRVSDCCTRLSTVPGRANLAPQTPRSAAWVLMQQNAGAAINFIMAFTAQVLICHASPAHILDGRSPFPYYVCMSYDHTPFTLMLPSRLSL